MRGISRSIPLVCFIALATGCSGATHSAEQPSPTATSPSTTATKPAGRAGIRNLPPVAKLTAACPLLSVAELKTLLGGGTSKTKVTATESKPPAPGIRECKYGSHGNDPFELVVDGLTQKGWTPKAEIDAIVKQHLLDKTRIRRVSGVGEAAAFLTFTDGTSELMASKRSHGQTRLAGFQAPTVVPERKFVDVVKLVTSRV
jgi:hypothetical protein